MREVSKTLGDLGIAAEMTRGTINRQHELGGLGLSLLDLDSFDARIAAIESALEKNPG